MRQRDGKLLETRRFARRLHNAARRLGVPRERTVQRDVEGLEAAETPVGERRGEELRGAGTDRVGARAERGDLSIYK